MCEYTVNHMKDRLFEQYLLLKEVFLDDILNNILLLEFKAFKTVDYLGSINAHPRDARILFQEDGHKYTLLNEDGSVNDNKTLSVTTLIHNYFSHFDPDKIIEKMMKSRNWPNSKYFGMTAEDIKKQWDDNRDLQAGRGTYIHLCIEQFFNGMDVVEKSVEFGYFNKFWYDFGLKCSQFKPYRTEMLIFNELFGKDRVTLCGSVDKILHDGEGNYIILDWKRSKQISFDDKYEHKVGLFPFEDLPDCNHSHYKLQLNIYRHILETIYHMNIIFMMLVIVHPNQDSYECIPVDKYELDGIWDIL